MLISSVDVQAALPIAHRAGPMSRCRRLVRRSADPDMGTSIMLYVAPARRWAFRASARPAVG
jgi:hypothetical protein